MQGRPQIQIQTPGFPPGFGCELNLQNPEGLSNLQSHLLWQGFAQGAGNTEELNKIF